MVLMKFSKILFRIVLSLLSVCVGAMVVDGREGSALGILNDTDAYSTKAGLMIVGWLIGLVIGAVFGAICAICINCYFSHRVSTTR